MLRDNFIPYAMRLLLCVTVVEQGKAGVTVEIINPLTTQLIKPPSLIGWHGIVASNPTHNIQVDLFFLKLLDNFGGV